MKKAIVTVAIGPGWDQIAAVSDPLARDWAQRIGASRIVITTPQFPTPYRAYEKLQVRDLLAGEFDRVAVVDADILIRPDAPDVFEEVPEGKWGALLTHVGETESLKKTYTEHAGRLKMPVPPFSGQYFCAGFFVCERRHRDIFCDPPKWAHAFYEQTYLNIRVLETNAPVHDLGWRWNCPTIKGREDAWGVHYKRSCCHHHVEEFCGLLEGRKAVWRKAGLL